MGKVVVTKIKELMKKNNIDSISKLSEITGIRRAALSEILNSKRQRIEFTHIEKIAESLDIDDIREIIDITEE